MSRMIKVRAWDITDKCMEYDVLTGLAENEMWSADISCWNVANNMQTGSTDAGLIFMLSTGLTDSNDEEIYESDICTVAGEDGYFEVFWDDDSARFALKNDWLTVDFDNYYGKECTVEGNIYQNNNLLTGDEIDDEEAN